MIATILSFVLCPFCKGNKTRDVSVRGTIAHAKCPQCKGKGWLNKHEQEAYAWAMGDGIT